MATQKETLGLFLLCEGMGDCLYAMAVIKKLHMLFSAANVFDLFTHHPGLFSAGPKTPFFIKNARPNSRRMAYSNPVDS
jgi:hypothetical protein